MENQGSENSCESRQFFWKWYRAQVHGLGALRRLLYLKGNWVNGERLTTRQTPCSPARLPGRELGLGNKERGQCNLMLCSQVVWSHKSLLVYGAWVGTNLEYVCNLDKAGEAEEWVQKDELTWFVGIPFQHSSELCEDTGVKSTASHSESSDLVLSAVPQPARIPQSTSQWVSSITVSIPLGSASKVFPKHFQNMFIKLASIGFNNKNICALWMVSLLGISNNSAIT